MAKIKNIIFDFGGVLIDLDVNKTYDAMSEVLDMPINAEVLTAHQDVLENYECGLVSTETFLWRFQYISKLVPPAPALIRAWNAMIIGWQQEKLDFLEDIGKKYNTYLLSNTNELHLQKVHKDLKNQHHITDFESRFFKKAYYSHRVKMRKPDKSIFELVLSDAGINASETVFIDDLPSNIKTASSLGLHSILHPTNAPLSEEYILGQI